MIDMLHFLKKNLMITQISGIALKDERALLWALYLATPYNDGLPAAEFLVKAFYNRFNDTKV